ncbi:MAG: hypothetical protein LBV47_06580 [Bacteroidales bacterium]|nr:hypothetical protein [Bacteroidales bacterium]
MGSQRNLYLRVDSRGRIEEQVSLQGKERFVEAVVYRVYENYGVDLFTA